MAFFDKLKAGLSKTKDALFGKVKDLFINMREVDEDLFDELEEILITADVGVAGTEMILEKLRYTVKSEKITESERVYEELKKIIYDYGEERFAPKIASAIVAKRQIAPIETTGELVDIIKGAMPSAALNGGHHPAKRTFQAIRIEVNGELAVIEPAIRSASEIMNEGGRIAIITFHSLEDRIVKQTFADMASGCTCPKDFPICICGKKPDVKVISRKPVLPSKEELEVNPRSRSAKLRIAEKL